jgi:hypothetical protein
MSLTQQGAISPPGSSTTSDMKKLLYSLAFVPILVFSPPRHQPTPTPPTTTPTSTFCFNFGHDLITNQTEVKEQLQELHKYSNCVRLAYTSFGSSLSESDALLAQSMGIRVIIGGTWYANNTNEITSADLPAYTSSVLAMAKWAQQNKIPQISIGNEQESSLSGISVCQWNAYLQSLYSQVRGTYSGTISYEMNSQYLSQYIGCGQVKGLLYGLNLYGGYSYNASTLQQAINAFSASNVYVSETDCDLSNSSTGCANSDAAHASEVEGDAVQLRKNFPNTPIYYFTWGADGNDGVPSYWGLYNGLTLQQPDTLAEL